MNARTSVLRKSYPICDRCLVNGKPEEHFFTVLLVRSTDAGIIAEALQCFIQHKQLDLRKLIGQGYDGAATFARKISGVLSKFRPPLLKQSTSTVLVTGYSLLQFRQLHQ